MTLAPRHITLFPILNALSPVALVAGVTSTNLQKSPFLHLGYQAGVSREQQRSLPLSEYRQSP